MAKIKKIGNKEEILKKKSEHADWAKRLDSIAVKTDKQLQTWLNKHFSTLPAEVRSGLEEMVLTAWANANVIKELQLKE